MYSLQQSNTGLIELFANDQCSNLADIQFYFYSDQCASCKSGYFLEEESYQCLKCQQDNCLACTNSTSCLECLQGFTLVKNATQCQQCNVSNCSNCYSDISKCTQCNLGYNLSLDFLKCVASTKCSSGYFLSVQEQKCIQCSLNCFQCQSESTCSECISQIYQIDQNGQCYLQCSSDCDECELSQLLKQIACTKCKNIQDSNGVIIQQQYDYIKNQCVPCSANCKNCVSAYNVYLMNNEQVQQQFLSNVYPHFDQMQLNIQKMSASENRSIICTECLQSYQYDTYFNTCGECNDPTFLCERKVQILYELDCSTSQNTLVFKLDFNEYDQYNLLQISIITITLSFKDQSCKLSSILQISNQIYFFMPKTELVLQIDNQSIDLNGYDLSFTQFNQVFISNSQISNSQNLARRSTILFEGMDSDILSSKISISNVEFVSCFCIQDYSKIEGINFQKISVENSLMIAYQLFDFSKSNSLQEIIINDLKIKNHYFYNDISLFRLKYNQLLSNQERYINLNFIQIIDCSIVDSNLIFIEHQERKPILFFKNPSIVNSNFLRSSMIKISSDGQIDNLIVTNCNIIASQLIIVKDSSVALTGSTISVDQNFIDSILMAINSTQQKIGGQTANTVLISNIQLRLNKVLQYTLFQIDGYNQIELTMVTLQIADFAQKINQFQDLIYSYQYNNECYTIQLSNFYVTYNTQVQNQLISITNTLQIQMTSITLTSQIADKTYEISSDQQDSIPSIFCIASSNLIQIASSNFSNSIYSIFHFIDQVQTIISDSTFDSNTSLIINSQQNAPFKQLGIIKFQSSQIIKNTIKQTQLSLIQSQNDFIKLEKCITIGNLLAQSQYIFLIFFNIDKIYPPPLQLFLFQTTSDTPLDNSQKSYLRIQGDITRSQIQVVDKNITALILNKVIVVGCLPGEFYNKKTNICDVCGYGTYSLIYNSSECLQCPDNSECHGGMNIELNQGYWRENMYSDEIVQCDEIIHTEICLGGSQNQTCKEGYIGALCQKCDLFGEQCSESYYNPSGSYQNCQTCKNSIKSIVTMFVFLTVFFIASMSWSIKKNMDIVYVKITQAHMNNLGFLSKGIDQPSFIIKICNHYMQITGVISSFKLSSLSSVTEMFDFISNPFEFSGSSFDCLLKDNEQIIPYIYMKVIILTTYFVCLIMLFFLIFLLLKIFKLTSYKFHHVFCTTLTYTFIILQPSIINLLFKLLSCRTVSGKQYMTYYMDQTCWTKEHLLYSWALICPLCVILIVIIPGLFIRMIFKNIKNDKLNFVDTRFSYGILYNEYTDEMSFWEILKIFEKIIIISVTQILGEEDVLKGIFIILFLFLYALLQMKYKPYQTPMLNRLDLEQTIISSITILIALLIKETSSITLLILGLILISVVNCYLFLIIFRYLLMGYTQLFEVKIEQLKEIIIAKFPKTSQYITLKRQRLINIKKNWALLRKHFQTFVTLKRQGKFVTANVITTHAYLQNPQIFESLIKDKANCDQIFIETFIVNQSIRKYDRKAVVMNSNQLIGLQMFASILDRKKKLDIIKQKTMGNIQEEKNDLNNGSDEEEEEEEENQGGIKEDNPESNDESNVQHNQQESDESNTTLNSDNSPKQKEQVDESQNIDKIQMKEDVEVVQAMNDSPQFINIPQLNHIINEASKQTKKDQNTSIESNAYSLTNQSTNNHFLEGSIIEYQEERVPTIKHFESINQNTKWRRKSDNYY